ncbi:MAG: RNA pseudouridine synthase [Chitinophagaceae bacterium]|nr:MAG: RNA pseudouridine synthase [Chitinophagaceae bacterium]
MKLASLIIKETENWIALNKPSGLLSIPDRAGNEISLKKILQEKYPSIFTVHRLDRDTSGIIVFAKNEKAHKHLSLQFEQRQTTKIYFGFVVGTMQDKSGTIDAPIAEHWSQNGSMMVHRNGKSSLTNYQVLEDFGIYSFVQFSILTGRTHQIRVHANHIGHPIVCDNLYGDGKSILLSAFKSKFKLSKKEEEEKPLLGRLGLHAQQLQFKEQDGQSEMLVIPLAKDMEVTLRQLTKWKRR